MSDVISKIIGANPIRHGRSTVGVSDGGTIYAGGYSGNLNPPMNTGALESLLTDRFSMSDSTDNIISFVTRSQSVGTGIVPLSGVTEGAKVNLKAAASNTGYVYVGISGLTAGTNRATDGFELSAGQGLYVPIVQTGIVHLVANAANQLIYIFEV